MGPMLTPTPTESCFGVIGSVIRRAQLPIRRDVKTVGLRSWPASYRRDCTVEGPCIARSAA